MRVSRKTCAAGPQEGGRHAVSEFRRAVTVEKTIKNREGSDIAADCKRLKAVSQRRGIDETNSLDSILFRRAV